MLKLDFFLFEKGWGYPSLKYRPDVYVRLNKDVAWKMALQSFGKQTAEEGTMGTIWR